MALNFQVVVIGGGPGGYVAAIRAAQLGLKTAVVEMDRMGGICLNWGCIPTKALLQSAHLLEEMRKAQEFGLTAENIKADFSAVIQRSRNVADQMAKGVDFLMKKNNVTVVKGRGSFQDSKTLLVTNEKGETVETITADRYIIATGARARPFPGVPFDDEKIISSKEAMILKKAPARLGIIGAGAIGVEFADVYASMGTEVHIIEYLDHLLPNEDEEISKVLEKSFQKRKIQSYLGMSVDSLTKSEKSVLIKMHDKNDSAKTSELEVDSVLVGIGLAPNTENMNLEKIGVVLSKGFIEVNSRFQTHVPGIYAIGDCTGAPLLAHVASVEGIKAAEAIAIDMKSTSHHLEYIPVDYDHIPGCTYCHPEVASFGLTEKKAIALGHEIKIGRFPFTASGRARAQGDTTGLVKIVSDAKHGEILGAHIIGPNATEIISELMVGASMELTVQNMANIMHAHPTISESVMEACADVLGEAVNI